MKRISSKTRSYAICPIWYLRLVNKNDTRLSVIIFIYSRRHRWEFLDVEQDVYLHFGRVHFLNLLMTQQSDNNCGHNIIRGR